MERGTSKTVRRERPAVVIDEHGVICEWEPDMNHTDQIAKLLERL